jgi:putative transposase
MVDATRVQVGPDVPAVALTDKQRACAEAALILANAVAEAMADAACSARQACTSLARQIVAGSVPAELLDAARITYLRPRKGTHCGAESALQQRLKRMYARYARGQDAGDPAQFLVPAQHRGGGKARDEDTAALLEHYCKPSRPTVATAWRASAPWYAARGLQRPSLHTFQRIAARLPVAQKNRGRMTGAEWRALLPYISRDVSMFHSNDIWVGDGHSFKARVQHPIHGSPFRPEITVVMDWVSRRIVGWSVDLAESTIAVSAAFRDSQIRTRSRPLVYYSDNGAGQTGKAIDCPIHGALIRQGIARETGIPGNPQGRGVMERLWQTVFIPLAETYPTFMGDQADKGSIRKVTARIAKDLRAGRESKELPTWPAFLADLSQAIETYNQTHEHGALRGKVPAVEYVERLDPTSEVFRIDDREIEALWMPEVRRTPSRGLIQLFNNHYSLPSLVDVLPAGASVRVRFDIHRAQHIWVLAMDGRLLGVAQWNGHRHAAFPVPFIEQKRAERAAGVRKRALREIERADSDAQASLFDPPPTQHMPADATGSPASNVHFLATTHARPAQQAEAAKLRQEEEAELLRRELHTRALRLANEAARGAP